jgi:hypothetical protein
MPDKLSFGKGNSKLDKKIYTFSLPSGYSCPGAKFCLSRADRYTGKIKDGPGIHYRCFSASQEALYPSVRRQRWRNFKALQNAKTPAKMTHLIMDSLPESAEVVRVHVSGDFFSDVYFKAWMSVASVRSSTRFYAYTKSLAIWMRHSDLVPSNFVLVASEGGRFDNLIKANSLRTATVVDTLEKAEALGLEVDFDDSLAYDSDKSFALLLHGQQPSGSLAKKAQSNHKIIKGKKLQHADRR